MHQTRDPQIIGQAVLLIFAKLVMVTAIALLVSSFATSSIFTIVTTFMIYLVGYMESTGTRSLAGERRRSIPLGKAARWSARRFRCSSRDMNSFTIVNEILRRKPRPVERHTLSLLGYADVYIIVLLAVSIVIFDYREI